MNILFTCVGRRHYLVEYFKLINGVKVIACDAYKYAPALYFAHEFFIVPEVNDKNYIPILLNESKARKVDLIIPLNDLELSVMALNKPKFDCEGIHIIVSDKEVIDLCFDKYRLGSFIENISVKEIPTFLNLVEALEYKEENPECKFIIKPRWGSASFGLGYPRNNEELISQFSKLKANLRRSHLNYIISSDIDRSILIQEEIIGQEFGLDVINNLDSKYEATLIRKKIMMRAGETDKAETVYDERLSKIGEEIGNKLKHICNLDCDLIIRNEEIYLLEMNPRFGGGYPFMHTAGANLPLALVEWIKGNKTPAGCFKYKDGLISAKVDKIVMLGAKENVYLIGASGFGREIESWISKSNNFNDRFILKGFLDDNLNALKDYPSDYEILGEINNFQFTSENYVILAIADPRHKEKIYNSLKNKVRFLSFIFDNAIIGKNVNIGEGTIIAPNCILSTNINIGRLVTVNIGTNIGHDTTIEDFSSVMANVDVSGGVRIGAKVYIGSNSTITPKLVVENNTNISAGSIVVSDISENSFVFGNPARKYSQEK